MGWLKAVYENINIDLLSIDGKKLTYPEEQPRSISGNTRSFLLPQYFPAGVYFLRIQFKSPVVFIRKIIIAESNRL